MSTNQDAPDSTSVYEDEVEVEVTDDEVDVPLEEDSEAESAARQSTPRSVSTPKPIGKAQPTKEVKSLEMRSPESVAKDVRKKLPSNKNPFPMFGAWTEDTLSMIDIVVPVLTNKNETTNDLTKESKPEARYWKAPITFKYGKYTSDTIRFDNVPIPYHEGRRYGSGYVYLCLPGFAATKFAEAGKTRRPTVVYEKNLQPDRNRWWKVANRVENSFGIINAETKKFQKKSLDVIFAATNKGIIASVILQFNFKASTDNKEPLKPTTTGTISVELQRAYIKQTDVLVEMPVRLNTKRSKADPAHSRSSSSRDGADKKKTVSSTEMRLTFENVIHSVSGYNSNVLDKESVVKCLRSIYNWMAFDSNMQLYLPITPGSVQTKMWPHGATVDTRKNPDTAVNERSSRKLKQIDEDHAANVANSIVSPTYDDQKSVRSKGEIMVATPRGVFQPHHVTVRPQPSSVGYAQPSERIRIVPDGYGLTDAPLPIRDAVEYREDSVPRYSAPIPQRYAPQQDVPILEHKRTYPSGVPDGYGGPPLQPNLESPPVPSGSGSRIIPRYSVIAAAVPPVAAKETPEATPAQVFTTRKEMRPKVGTTRRRRKDDTGEAIVFAD